MKYDICVYATYEKTGLKQLLKKAFRTIKKNSEILNKSCEFY